MTQRLPNVGGDNNGWGNVLNGFLGVAANTDGRPKAPTYDPRLRWVGSVVKRRLQDEAASFGIGFLGDSKGNDIPSGGSTGDWPYELGALIAAAYPDWTVEQRIFSDANQDYASPTVIQTGTNGSRYVPFVNGVSHTRSIPHAEIAMPAPIIDISILVELDDWTPAADNCIFSHYGTAGSRGFRFSISNAVSGRPTFIYTTDGTTDVTKQCSAAPTVSDGSPLWIRVVFNGNDGSGNNITTFYTSPANDGATWTQLGSTITTAVTAVVFDPTVVWEIGGRGTNGAVMNGKIYRVVIRNGTLGPTIAPVFPEAWQPTDSSAPAATGAPVLALVTGCVSGEGITYLGDSTRLPKLLPDYSLGPIFCCTQANDASGGGPPQGFSDGAYAAAWTAWLTAIKARAPRSSPILTTQNPEYSPVAATFLALYARFRPLILDMAHQQGLPMFDAWQAFTDTGDPTDYVNASDGIHPTLTVGPNGYSGAQVWANDAYFGLFD